MTNLTNLTLHHENILIYISTYQTTYVAKPLYIIPDKIRWIYQKI